MADAGFGVEVLAKTLRMSRTSLFLKLKSAAELLKETDSKVAAIAAQVGWLEHTHFDRAFKAHFGCSPSDYRKNL